jgi:hypothetical protein
MDMILSSLIPLNDDCNQLYCILHGKFVQKQIQISTYQKLLDIRGLYQSNNQQYKRTSSACILIKLDLYLNYFEITI